MDERVYIVAAITVGAGLVGGLGAYLAETPSPEAPPPRNALTRFFVLGLIAAGAVPLFLSLVESKVVGEIFKEGDTPAYESYLIFVGLCLVAAFSARAFITSVSTRVLQQRVADAAQEAAEAKRTAEAAASEAAQVAEEADDANAPPPAEAESPAAADTTESGAVAPITDVERRVLEAMTQRTFRTRMGIAEDARVSRNRISEVLQDLHGRGLAIPARSPETGGARWVITERGRAALDRS